MRLRPLLAAAVVAAVAAVAATSAASPASAASAQPSSWNFAQADIPAAQAPGAYGRGVTVAVIDTWVDSADAELGGRAAPGVSCLGGVSGAADCGAAQKPDGCTHGTHVAGTVASSDYGVAPEASILPVQVLVDSNGSCGGSTTDVASAVEWVVDGGHPRAQVINMSLGDTVAGLTQSPAVTAAVDDAAAAGVVVVIAAGNSNSPITDSYAAVGGAPAALLVAATGPNGSLAGYSNSGPSVAIAAPGGDSGGLSVPLLGPVSSSACSAADCVLSTVPGNATALMEGTSMATPHVAGTAALLLAQSPGRGRVSAIQAMTSTASPLSGAGAGRLDAGRALAVMASASPTSHASAAAPVASAAGAPATGAPAAAAPRSAPSSGAATSSRPTSGGSSAASPVGAHPSSRLSATGAAGAPPSAYSYATPPPGGAGAYGFTPVAPGAAGRASQVASSVRRRAGALPSGVPAWLAALAVASVVAAGLGLVVTRRRLSPLRASLASRR